MMNYPNDPIPTRIGNFTMDYKLDRMNRLLFFTVFIGQFKRKALQFICNGILIPLSFVFTCFIGYKIMKVSFQKQVKSIQVSFLFFALSEIICMQFFCTLFAVYYWTWGAVEYENEYGIRKPTCIVYLYTFKFVPSYFFTVSMITIGYMIIFEIKKRTKSIFFCPLNATTISVFYIFILMFCLWDLLALFIMTAITTVEGSSPANYQSKCFVMMSPLFDIMGITEWMKAFEWFARIFSNVVPHWLSITYLSVLLRVIYNQFHLIRHGKVLLRGEVQYYAGPTVVFVIAIIILIFNSGFELFSDIHEINLHYSAKSTDMELFFTLKDIRTILRPLIFFLAPLLIISLCSVQPHFQETMLRYLNDGKQIKVTTLKTIGGDILIRAHYKKMPPKLSVLARIYKSFLRLHYASVLWNKFVDTWEDYSKSRKFARRSNIINQEIDKDMKRRRKELLHKEAYKKADIIVTVDGKTENRQTSVVLGRNTVHSVETTV